MTPFFSEVHTYVALSLWILDPGNLLHEHLLDRLLPLNSKGAFDNKTKSYNVSAVLGDDSYIDPEKYQKHGPPYYGAALIMEQGAWFATDSIPLVLSYIWIKKWKRLWKQMRSVWKSMTTRSSGFAGHDDPHSRMMARYPEVPDWWFLVILMLANIFGIIGAYCWPKNTP